MIGINTRTNLEECKQFSMNIFADWKEFYGNELSEPNYNKITYCQIDNCQNTNQFSPTQNNVWVSNCYFHDMSSSSSGGAISFRGSSSSHFLVEESNFDKCRMTDSSGDAGAINVCTSNSVLKSICCYDCFSMNYEGACNIDAVNGNSSNIKNYAHDSSAAHCTADEFIMYFRYGYIDITSVNISHNEVNYDSALDCEPSSAKDNIGTSVSFSSFSNNTATLLYSIYFDSTPAKTYELKNSNIIENRADRTIYVYDGVLVMTKTCMMNNKDVVYYFSLELTSVICELDDCSIDNIQKVGLGTITRKESRDSFVNALTFILTGNCVNIFDMIDNIRMTRFIEEKEISKCYTWNPGDELRQNLQIYIGVLEYIFLLY